MKIETYEQRILIPDENKYLYNAEAQSISEKVYLGINANADEWVEITQEEKEKIEKKWENA